MAPKKKMAKRMASPRKAKCPPTAVDTARCKRACRDVTAEQICEYLCSLQEWICQVTTCLQNAGICGPGGGVPANPPAWP